MMSKLMAAAILVSVSIIAAQAAGPTEDLSGWPTIAELNFPVDTPVAFRETRKTRLQRTAKTQSGTLWLETNGSFAMSLTQPRAEERRLNNTTLSLKRRGKTRTTTLDPERGAHQLLLSIVSVLQGDILKLKKNFSLQIENEPPASNPEINPADSPEQDWSLSLIPNNKKLKKELTKLTLRGRDNRLLSIRAERGQSFQKIELLNSGQNSPFVSGEENSDNDESHADPAL